MTLRSALSSRSRLLPPRGSGGRPRSLTRSTISTPASRSSLSVSLGEAAPGAARVEQLTSSASSSDPITSTRSELVVSIDARARGAAGGFARLVCARERKGRRRKRRRVSGNRRGGRGRQAAPRSESGRHHRRAFRARRWRSRRRARIDPIWTHRGPLWRPPRSFHGSVGNVETHRDHGPFSIHRVPNARPDEIGSAVVARGCVAHPRGLARPAALVPAHRARSLPRRPHDPAQPNVCASEAKTEDKKSAAGCLARRDAACASAVREF